jgi:tRNA U34 2-thiouridine synthase MnmA/TrmU
MQTICRINYSTRTLFTTCGRRRLSKQVAVALSGGIDSSVCAYLLQQQGHDVVGVYMRNWDNSDENASETCTSSSDYEDAKQVCEHLGIRLLEVHCMIHSC